MRFASGFFTASLLWAGLIGLYLFGLFGPLGPDVPAPVEEAPLVAETEPSTGPDKGKRGRRKRAANRGPNDRVTDQDPTGTNTVGEDIGWDQQQNVDMAGGEQQLAGSQIEAGFDSAMPKIRRCLILVDTDGDVSGKLTFGMRVGGDGVPKAVNLTGPAVVTGGESGSCLRSAAQSIRFASFQGPDMVFKYPITLQ